MKSFSSHCGLVILCNVVLATQDIRGKGQRFWVYGLKISSKKLNANAAYLNVFTSCRTLSKFILFNNFSLICNAPLCKHFIVYVATVWVIT